jgi:hypothetical protein
MAYSVADRMYLAMTTATMFKIPKEDYLKIWDRVAPQWERLTEQEEKKLELMTKVANYIMDKFPGLYIEKRLSEIKD